MYIMGVYGGSLESLMLKHCYPGNPSLGATRIHTRMDSSIRMRLSDLYM